MLWLKNNEFGASVQASALPAIVGCQGLRLSVPNRSNAIAIRSAFDQHGPDRISPAFAQVHVVLFIILNNPWIPSSESG
jgi:hypothetical protein